MRRNKSIYIIWITVRIHEHYQRGVHSLQSWFKYDNLTTPIYIPTYSVPSDLFRPSPCWYVGPAINKIHISISMGQKLKRYTCTRQRMMVWRENHQLQSNGINFKNETFIRNSYARLLILSIYFYFASI